MRQLGRQALAHSIDDGAAMLAYYGVLAIFPMAVFVVTLAIAVLPQAALDRGIAVAAHALPASLWLVVQDRVLTLTKGAATGFSIIAAAIALFSASRAAVSMMLVLDRVHDKRETRSWLRRQATALGVTLGVALLVVAAMALLVVGPIVGHFIADRFQLGEAFDWAWSIGRWVGAGALVMLVWAIAYKFLTDTHAPFRVFLPGAAAGVVLWLGISWLFQLYVVQFSSYAGMYGAFAGGIVFLTWLWLTTLVLLLGAEINDVLADFRRDRSRGARILASETRSEIARRA
ncbi:MAG TPA: YihY/virulence factor BrkB family protein [Kofleriaceae bacterium]